ncbi:MAG: LacI family DNA-binding transcriptional regulator [Anaerolineae bacterium]|nr:LacI family DNA-binding transcriptional regulator [Anaerolineae bacterium]
MTVSRVINDSGYISDETRARVEAAIKELGYIPNALARSLRFKQTRTIALIVTDITNPFFTTIARGVEDQASAEGFSVIFCNTDESPEEETQYVNVLLQKQVDGLLLVPTGGALEIVTFLNNHAVPFVLLDRTVPGTEADVVRSDSKQATYEGIQHLLDLGHTRIAALCGSEDITSSLDRGKGYQWAMQDAGLAEEATRRTYFTSFTVKGGYEAAQMALAETPRPTAIFATNNFIAIGAMRALREISLRVPEDISLICFDDLPDATLLDPFLTVIEQQAYDMGRQATALLLDRLNDKAPDEAQEIILPTKLIIRRSSAPPPTA